MIELVMVLHCHQPVGNFDSVFQKAHDRCYRPLLDLLEAHPGVRVGLHFSGPVFEWFETNRSDSLDLLAALVGRGQVEPLSGGFFEPLLATIPQADAQGQVRMMNDYIQRRFGVRPTGFWLTERIWDPGLPLTLDGCSLDYTVVDDTHFYYAGLTENDIFGPYITEREGRVLNILATPMVMRYMIPFWQVHDVMGHLKSWEEAGRPVAVYGDDGEKFGLWPGTYEWVIQKGWLDAFFSALESGSDWVRTVPPGEFSASRPPLGRLYMPQASYEEMTEWALPPARGRALEEIIATLKREDRWESWRPFVRGGVWDNFLVKYEESNRMHKKMQWLSEMAGPDPETRELVWRAQCNCGYWHGVFGGLYLGHLRRAIHENLIRAQARLVEGWGGATRLLQFDLDKDGLDEIVVMGPGLSFGLDPNRGGVIFDLCHMDRALNLADTLTRRPEAYHHKLAEAGRNQDPGGEIASIHDQVKVKEEGLEKLLIYDPCTRASLRDHFFEAEPSPEDFFAGQALESGDFLQAAYQVTRTQDGPDEAVATLTRTGRVGSTAVVVSKTLRAGRAPRLHVAYNLENTGPEPIETVYACEFCLTLYSDQDEDRYLTAPEIGNHHPVSETGREADLTRFELVNHGDGLKTTFTLSRPVNVSFFPLLNVSMSEDGFEKSYQGTVMHFCLPLRLEPGRPERLGFDIELKAI